MLRLPLGKLKVRDTNTFAFVYVIMPDSVGIKDVLSYPIEKWDGGIKRVFHIKTILCFIDVEDLVLVKDLIELDRVFYDLSTGGFVSVWCEYYSNNEQTLKTIPIMPLSCIKKFTYQYFYPSYIDLYINSFIRTNA